MQKKYIVFSVLTLGFLFLAQKALARTDLSISETDLTFSKDKLFDGDSVRIYARVSNVGDSDASGYVVFLLNNKEIKDPQPISVKTNTYDDVFIDWQAKAGTYEIAAKIAAQNPADEIPENNLAIKKDFFVDLDTDKDGIGNKNDPDIDNDGLTNEEESAAGTNPTKTDTDEDGVNDKIDTFPLDKTEWHDTNNNKLGDNKDPDADGDGITNEEEIKTYGTNPLSVDSDSDTIPDNQELESQTDPNKADTDNDGVNDSEDKYPLDPSKWQASLLDSIADFLGKDKKNIYIAGGALSALILFFLFFRRKKRR